jgi:hypothetical protein
MKSRGPVGSKEAARWLEVDEPITLGSRINVNH